MRIPILLLCCAAAALAQRTLDYDHSVVKQTRIDLRDLGYHPADVIPPDESAIRALAVAPDGTLFGATSGKRSHLFLMRPMHGFVQPLGFLKGVSTVHHALAIARNGDVFIGGSIGVDNNGEGYKGYEGGHVYKYVADGREEARPIRVDTPANVTDLGIPVPGEGVYTMAVDPLGRAYGVSYPGGQVWTSVNGKFEVLGRIAERRPPGEKFEHDLNLGRSIAVLHNTAYVSGENGAIWRALGPILERTGLTAPTVKGREPYNRVDAWAEGPEGIVYGATSDGYLFRMQGGKIENLGKPLNQYRIRGLVYAPNGLLYGVGGDDDEMARLFSYDPKRGVYDMLGMIDVSRRPYYAWQAYRVDAMAVGPDGTVYIGQAERKSRLYLYYPEQRRD
jgi:hypothetical protein